MLAVAWNAVQGQGKALGAVAFTWWSVKTVVWNNYNDLKKNIEEKKKQQKTKALNAQIRPEVKYQKVSQSALSPYLLKPQGK